MARELRSDARQIRLGAHEAVLRTTTKAQDPLQQERRNYALVSSQGQAEVFSNTR